MKLNTKEEVISLNVNKLENFYSDFTDEKSKVVDSAIVQYINDRAKNHSLKSKLKINIDVKDTSSKKKCAYCVRSLKNHYKDDIIDIKRQIRTTNLIALLLLSIALVFLVALNFLIQVQCPYILKTIMEIITWVFMWETVDIFCLRGTLLRIKLKKLNRIYHSDIKII